MHKPKEKLPLKTMLGSHRHFVVDFFVMLNKKFLQMTLGGLLKCFFS